MLTGYVKPTLHGRWNPSPPPSLVFLFLLKKTLNSPYLTKMFTFSILYKKYNYMKNHEKDKFYHLPGNFWTPIIPDWLGSCVSNRFVFSHTFGHIVTTDWFTCLGWQVRSVRGRGLLQDLDGRQVYGQRRNLSHALDDENENFSVILWHSLILSLVWKWEQFNG